MSQNPVVVGPFASKCDIVMFVLENQCIGQTPAVPTDPYLLLVLMEGGEGKVLLVRAAGITKPAQLRFEEQGIPLMKTHPIMEKMLNDYFAISWEQFQEHMERLRREKHILPESGMVQ
jgi:hypothetical protein